MKKLLFILALALWGLNTNAQVAGGQISRQKSTQKSTPKTTQKSTQKTNQQPVQRQQKQRGNSGQSNRQGTVTAKQNTSKSGLSCPDGNHPHMIDLGLPSGTKWACCNVGADKPEDYGGYYAWGETQTKGTFNMETYKHYDVSRKSYQKIGNDIAGTQYDVAHVNWGGAWVMPSEAQLDELKKNCTYRWTTINGINGGMFRGKNGRDVFLPAEGRTGDYWSSTLDLSMSAYAYALDFYSGHVDWVNIIRYKGCTVRPVSK